MTQQLPTQREMFLNTLEALDSARRYLSDARDWLNSDWPPAEMRAGLPAGLGEIRIDTKRQIGEAKNLIDSMKGELYRALEVLDPHAREADFGDD